MVFWKILEKIVVVIIGAILKKIIVVMEVGFSIWEKIVEFCKSLKPEFVDYVKFGRYPQTAKGEVRPVEWRVLARENNKALVISRYGLYAWLFNKDDNNWEKSVSRKWLNGEFYNSSFSGEEKARIISFNQDNVFLLSREEAEKYFADDDARKCKPTAYAKAKGVWTGDNGCGEWWLRSSNMGLVDNVNHYGVVNSINVYGFIGFMRPALWINLES